jgi:hypothetical protein
LDSFGNFSYIRIIHWIVIWIHKLYASRYELDIHSKEHKRIKKKKLFFLRVLERNILIKKRNDVLKILKPNKWPGEDGIISEFYITHWEQIKDEFFLLVNDTFEKKELTPSQYKGVLTLLHKSGEREDIRNWRPLTLLNSDYKIIAERSKVVLPKLICKRS